MAAFQSKVGVADTHMVTMSTPHPPVIHSIYDGYWFWGRLSLDDLWLDLRAAAREIRPDWDPSTPRLREAWAAGDWSSFRGWDRRSPEHKARQRRRRHFNQTGPSRRRRRADMGSWTCQVTSERRGWVMELFPPMPLVQWQDTKATLHRFAQVVGKIRLAASVRRNHWWNVPFHVTGRGIPSRLMGQAGGNPIFTIDFDFVDDRLLVTTGDGKAVSSPLYGRSVAVFYRGNPGHPAVAGRACGHRPAGALRPARR
ncbi:DUF5996 family protein [Micromonospora purpureochromogenes]|uniref:DUF5996 family protein n=1 Tax=Micromonospora purpureochromogenes TaxID=47872 RepID=UPI003324FF3A